MWAMPERWAAVVPMTVAAAPAEVPRSSPLRLVGAALLCVAVVVVSSHSASARDGLLQTYQQPYPPQSAQARLAYQQPYQQPYPQPQYAQYAARPQQPLRQQLQQPPVVMGRRIRCTKQAATCFPRMPNTAAIADKARPKATERRASNAVLLAGSRLLK